MAKLEKVVETDKTVAAYQAELAKVYRSTATAHSKKGEKVKAAEFYDKATAIFRRLRDANSLREPDKKKLNTTNDFPDFYNQARC